MFAIYLLRVLQRLEKNVRDSVQRGRKNCESIDFFFFKSYFTIQIWNSFERLGKHGRKEDYKISLTYFLVTKISNANSKYKSRQQIVDAQEFTFIACFQKGKKLKIFSCRFRVQSIFGKINSLTFRCEKYMFLPNQYVKKEAIFPDFTNEFAYKNK